MNRSKNFHLKEIATEYQFRRVVLCDFVMWVINFSLNKNRILVIWIVFWVRRERQSEWRILTSIYYFFNCCCCYPEVFILNSLFSLGRCCFFMIWFNPSYTYIISLLYPNEIFNVLPATKLNFFFTPTQFNQKMKEWDLYKNWTAVYK